MLSIHEIKVGISMTADVEVASTPVIVSVIIPTQPQDLCTMMMHNILAIGFLLNMPNYGCIPIQRLHPSMPCEGCPNSKAPPNAPHNPFGGCTATVLHSVPYTKILNLTKKKNARRKMATSHGIDHHFCRPGQQKLCHKGREILRRLDVPLNNG